MIRNKFYFLLLGLNAFCSYGAGPEGIRMESDNKELETVFNWSVGKAGTFVMTGKEIEANVAEDGPVLGYRESIKCIPSYWAGYANRTAFYCRDFSRQSLGAHLIGLDEENFSMYKSFANHCTEDKKWYSWWALNFDGSVYTLDAPNPPGEGKYEGYPSDFKNPEGERFVREVPSNFNLIHNSYKCYLWTNDKRYVTDVSLKRMREKSMNDFFKVHDIDGNGIPEGIGDIWVGSSSYNERDLHPKEAGDAASLVYAARLAYSGFLAADGNMEQARIEKKKADDFYSYFNDVWSRIPGDSMFVSAILRDGTPFNGFSRETTFLMPIYGITAPGERTEKLLDLIIDQIGDGVDSDNPGPKAMPNIESYTYLPQLFFAYNRVSEAYKFVKYIAAILHKPHEVASQGFNSEFPEVSFTMISNLVEGMMGVRADAPRNTIYTVSRLPEDTRYVTVKNIKMGASTFCLTHTGNDSSELSYSKGCEPYTWTAEFYGDYSELYVDGMPVKASRKEINGKRVSYVNVTIKKGENKKVFIKQK